MGRGAQKGGRTQRGGGRVCIDQGKALSNGETVKISLSLINSPSCAQDAGQLRFSPGSRRSLENKRAHGGRATGRAKHRSTGTERKSPSQGSVRGKAVRHVEIRKATSDAVFESGA